MPVIPRICPVSLAAAVVCASLLCGCSGQREVRLEDGEAGAALRISTADAASQPMFHGETGRRMEWADLLDAMREADVVIVGEQHGHAMGHAVERALVEEAFRLWPGTVLSLEMLERDEQAAVDDYLSGVIDLETFLDRTRSTKWRDIVEQYLEGTIRRREFVRRITSVGWPDWSANYQPLLDAAKEASARVVAANAPWRYMSRGASDGYERLEDLSGAQRALFALPGDADVREYRARFWQTMVGRAEGETANAHGTNDDAVHGGLSDERVAQAFRGQRIWDATMADSIRRALEDRANRVIHIGGAFHSDFNGGTAAELRHRLPFAATSVLTISLVPRDAIQLDEEDLGRADVVVYVGE